MTDRNDLALVLSSGVPIVVIETTDEARFLELLTDIAVSTTSAEYRPLFRWSITDGLQRLDLDLEPQRHNVEPRDVLGHIRSVSKPGLYALLDFHPFLNDPVNTRLLKDIAITGADQGTVVLQVEVHEDGKAHNIRVVRSLGLGLDEKAVQAVEQWKFIPGRKEGKPVKVAATIEVRVPISNSFGRHATARVSISPSRSTASW